MKIRPTQISGAWRLGWTLDVHTTTSRFFGYDPDGHPLFETERSPIGELLYQLKYRSRDTKSGVVDVMAQFLTGKPNALSRINLIVPVPASTLRKVQPVYEVAKELRQRLQIPVETGAIMKTRHTPELKSIYNAEERREILEGALRADHATVRNKGVLLIDDLYRSGATANAATLALIMAGASPVYFLAATRTRSNL